MLKVVPIRGLAYPIFILSTLFFITMVTFFFLEIATETSPYTAGGIAAPIQLYYNMLNGYYFNTSLFASDLTGQSVGFTNNPFSYLHIFAIHTYVSSFAFVPLWGLWPNVYWMYALILCINYISLIGFTILILRKWSPDSYKIKTLVALTLLFSSGFLFTFQQNAQLLLFSTPYILGAVYFLWMDKKLYFLLCTILLSLISEDAAFIVLTFSIYIFFFEQNKRWYAIAAGGFSLIYIACVLFIVQPATRHYLGSAESNTALVVFRYIFDLTWPLFFERLWGLAPALTFIMAIPIAYMLFPNAAIPWKRVFAVAILPPLPHWGESVVVGAVHHLAPVLVFMYVALIMVLGTLKDQHTSNIFMTRKMACSTTLFFILFSSCNLRVLISNFPADVLKPLYTVLEFDVRVKKINERLLEAPKNRHIINTVNTIPKDSSLVYLTNSSVEGFIANRTHIWKFPDYLEQADYVLIQPQARQSFFDGKKAESARYADLIKPGAAEHYFSSSDQGVITNDLVVTIREELVSARDLYRIAIDNDEVILLERIVKVPSLIVPPSTLGFGWLPNVFKDKH